MLKYLFTATLSDGSKIVQPVDDSSPSGLTKVAPDGKVHPGTAFTDVNERLDEVVHFSLADLDGHEALSVDLKTGQFTLGERGTAVVALDPQVILTPATKFKLIYFRRTNLSFPSPVPNSIQYHVGWQVTQNGKAYKYTLFVE